MSQAKPTRRPARPFFSSGPCAKRPGWSPAALERCVPGPLAPRQGGQGEARRGDRRRRATARPARRLPVGHRAGVRHRRGRDGAVVAARPARRRHAGLGELRQGLGHRRARSSSRSTTRASSRPNTASCRTSAQVDWSRDVVFTWNGTTSGVRVPDGDWIADDREGLADLRRDLGRLRHGAALGQARRRHLVLAEGAGRRGAPTACWCFSPRAVERLETYVPPRPLPKIFRLTKGGKLIEGVFARRDHQHALHAVRRGCARRPALGRTASAASTALIARSRRQSRRPRRWVDAHDWIDFLAADPATRSPHLDVPDRRSWCDAPTPADRAKAMADAAGGRGRRLRYRRLPRARRRACASGAAPPSTPPISKRCCPGSTGLATEDRRPRTGAAS